MAAWNRQEVSYCRCSKLKYVHAHCPCYNCNGKAVSRATEYRHWVEANLEGSSIAHAQFDFDSSDNIVSNESIDTIEDSTLDLESPCANDLPVVAAVSTPTNISEQSTDKESSVSHVACTFGEDIDKDIAIAVLRAFAIMDDTGGSQKSMLQILEFGRDCYCKGNHEISKGWPTTWSACMKVLKQAGYKEPKEHYICLNESHPNLWSISDNPRSCRFCDEVPTIQFYYLPLSEKIHRWCSNELFCNKITAHWTDRENWLYDHEEDHDKTYNEIWDGSRFHELRWFWDPEAEWLLPTRCNVCREVISAEVISVALHTRMPMEQNVDIKCTNCATRFSHLPKYARGDPRNLALIGHWDGWQPFSTSIKHSCGMLI